MLHFEPKCSDQMSSAPEYEENRVAFKELIRTYQLYLLAIYCALFPNKDKYYTEMSTILANDIQSPTVLFYFLLFIHINK